MGTRLYPLSYPSAGEGLEPAFRQRGFTGGAAPSYAFTYGGGSSELGVASTHILDLDEGNVQMWSFWVNCPNWGGADKTLWDCWTASSTRQFAVIWEVASKRFYVAFTGNGGSAAFEFPGTSIPAEFNDGSDQPLTDTWIHMAFKVTGTASSPGIAFNTEKTSNIETLTGCTCSRYPRSGYWTDGNHRFFHDRNSLEKFPTGTKITQPRLSTGWTARSDFFTREDWKYYFDETIETDVEHAWPFQVVNGTIGSGGTTPGEGLYATPTLNLNVGTLTHTQDGPVLKSR